ncbi:MAG: hypothetical protein ACFFFB_01700 [Candidatus Heimdallarchaeota archaeon]
MYFLSNLDHPISIQIWELNMELFEEEIELYNAKLRLLSWLYDELKIQKDISKDFLNEKGQKLPLNL